MKKRLTRREAISMIGAAGSTVAWGCGSDSLARLSSANSTTAPTTGGSAACAVKREYAESQPIYVVMRGGATASNQTAPLALDMRRYVDRMLTGSGPGGVVEPRVPIPFVMAPIQVDGALRAIVVLPPSPAAADWGCPSRARSSSDTAGKSAWRAGRAPRSSPSPCLRLQSNRVAQGFSPGIAALKGCATSRHSCRRTCSPRPTP